MHLTVLVSFFFNKSTEASKAVFSFRLQSLKSTRQLFAITIMNMCTLLRFTYTATIRLIQIWETSWLYFIISTPQLFTEQVLLMSISSGQYKIVQSWDIKEHRFLIACLHSSLNMILFKIIVCVRQPSSDIISDRIFRKSVFASLLSHFFLQVMTFQSLCLWTHLIWYCCKFFLVMLSQ